MTQQNDQTAPPFLTAVPEEWVFDSKDDLVENAFIAGMAWQEHQDQSALASERAKNAAAEATIARAMRISERPEVVPIEDAVRRHAFLKGYEQAWDAFRTHLAVAPTAAPNPVQSDEWGMR